MKAQTLVISLLAPMLVAAPASAACWTYNANATGKMSATALEGCQKYVAENPPVPDARRTTAFLKPPAANGIRDCWARVTHNDNTTGEYSLGSVYVNEALAPREYCDAQPTGPYRFVDMGNTPIGSGEKYSGGDSGQAARVRSKNYQKCNGKLRSDFCSPAGAAALASMGVEGGEYCDDNGLDLIGHNNANRAPNVHHVVPRVDNQSCGCGWNSAGNALLISARVNKLLGNKRPTQQMLDYVNGLDPNQCQGAPLN